MLSTKYVQDIYGAIGNKSEKERKEGRSFGPVQGLHLKHI